MLLPVYTIGHSNRTVEAFIDLLTAQNVTQLVDIRSMTMSRANPQFNAEPLAASLAERGISYLHIAALGGLRRSMSRLCWAGVRTPLAQTASAGHSG